MVTGGAGHFHVTGGELQTHRARERERERERESDLVVRSLQVFCSGSTRSNCGRQLSRRICVTNCLSIFVCEIVSASQSYSILFYFFLDLSCVVLLSCVFIFFIFLIQASSSSSSSSSVIFSSCVNT